MQEESYVTSQDTAALFLFSQSHSASVMEEKYITSICDS